MTCVVVIGGIGKMGTSGEVGNRKIVFVILGFLVSLAFCGTVWAVSVQAEDDFYEVFMDTELHGIVYEITGNVETITDYNHEVTIVREGETITINGIVYSAQEDEREFERLNDRFERLKRRASQPQSTGTLYSAPEYYEADSSAVTGNSWLMYAQNPQRTNHYGDGYAVIDWQGDGSNLIWSMQAEATDEWSMPVIHDNLYLWHGPYWQEEPGDPLGKFGAYDLHTGDPIWTISNDNDTVGCPENMRLEYL
ncbi:hypothetical protein KKA03_06400, partial [archaeon]|nr:hypothetical protein [archaeon]